MSDPRPEREAIVIGYGFEYLVMAINCAHSIRASNPGITTTLVTNVPIETARLADAFDRVIVRDEPADLNRMVKTSVLDHTIAEKVLYVDADSEVVGDLDPFFRLLDRFDVVLRLQAVPVNKSFELTEGIPGGAFPHYHGGAFLLAEGESARGFLAHWQRRMVESGLNRDQPALARTVYDLPDLRLLVVNSVLCSDEFEMHTLFKPKHEQPRIHHYRDPSSDKQLVRRLRGFAEALSRHADGDRGALNADTERVLRRYRRITHPLHTNRLTRRAFRWFSGRVLDPAAASGPAGRVQRVRGSAYVSGVGRLWRDDE